MLIFFITLLILAYLIGAVPTGYWICKIFYGTDITKFGSGNTGATNVARVKGKLLFLPIFLIDAGKAYLTLDFVDSSLNQFYGHQNLAGFIFAVAGALLLGNAYSVFIGFKGGKGVATTSGIIAFTLSGAFLMTFAFLWLCILGVTKRPYMASIGAMFLLLCAVIVFGNRDNGQIFFITCLFLWLLFRHQENIKKFC